MMSEAVGRAEEYLATTERSRGRHTLAPVSILLVAICAIVAVISSFGSDKQSIAGLFFTSRGDLSEINSGELWRLITPMFIHFGFLHLLFNMSWLVDLGTKIEVAIRSPRFAIFVLLSAAASNYAQFAFGSFGLFGGMSGVVYALIGYAWVRGYLDRECGVRLDSKEVAFALVWFALGFTGAVGPIANAAHAGGLVCGISYAVVHVRLSRSAARVRSDLVTLMHHSSSQPHPQTSDTWSIPPLGQSPLETWSPPPLTSPTVPDSGPHRRFTSVVSLPREDSSAEEREGVFSPSRRLLYVSGLVIAFAVVAGNYAALKRGITERFWGEPRSGWITQAVKQQLEPVTFGSASRIQIDRSRVEKLSDGHVRITSSGKVTSAAPLYKRVPLQDPELGLQSELSQLRQASDEASLLRERGGVDAGTLDVTGFAFFREAAPGASVAFEATLGATRSQLAWSADGNTSLAINPAVEEAGLPYAKLPESAVMVGTEKTGSQKAALIAKIQSYVRVVNGAAAASKRRFIAQGKDAQGSPRFPQQPMPGERYSQTRLEMLNPDALQSWPEDNLQYALNELVARHGAEFRDANLSRWFRQFSWYRPVASATPESVESDLSDVELQNVKSMGTLLLIKHEDATKRRQAQEARQQAAAAEQQRAYAARSAAEAAERKRQQQAAAAAAAIGIIGGILSNIHHK